MTRKTALYPLFLTVLCCISSSIFAHDNSDNYASISNALKKSEIIFTLSGLKPVSLIFLSNSEHNAQLPHQLELGFLNGQLTNRNFGYFYTQWSGRNFLFVYNRAALKKLLADPKRMKFLERYGFKESDSPDGAIEKLKSLWSECNATGQKRTPEGSYKFDLVNGILFGFPTEDVLAFAKITKLQSTGLTKEAAEIQVTGKKMEHQFGKLREIDIMTAYIRYTGIDSPENQRYLREANTALALLKKLESKGYSPWQIINNWDAEFCKAALLP